MAAYAPTRPHATHREGRGSRRIPHRAPHGSLCARGKRPPRIRQSRPYLKPPIHMPMESYSDADDADHGRILDQAYPSLSLPLDNVRAR